MLRLQWRHHHPIAQRRYHSDCFRPAHRNATNRGRRAFQPSIGSIHSSGRTHSVTIG